MAASKWGRPPPRDAASDLPECRLLASFDSSENSTSGQNLKAIPSRAALARRWPSLRLNRFTGRWRDDASGARGDTLRRALLRLSNGAAAGPLGALLDLVEEERQ